MWQGKPATYPRIQIGERVGVTSPSSPAGSERW